MGHVDTDRSNFQPSAAGWIPDWPLHPRVRAVSTTREGGISPPPFDSMNVALHVGDELANVQRNRAILSARAELPREPVWLDQVHGKRVVRAQPGKLLQADACWTDQPDIPCVVMTADCLPILLADTDGRCICAVHAGWRGLAAGIIGAAVDALPSPAVALTAWLGPAISGAAYEVGPEVRHAFLSRSANLAGAFTSQGDDRYHCDLYRAARIQLDEIGVSRIYGGERCTYREATSYFSHRRDGRGGRMAHLIWLSAEN